MLTHCRQQGFYCVLFSEVFSDVGDISVKSTGSHGANNFSRLKKKGKKKKEITPTDQRQIYDCIAYIHISTSLALLVPTEEIKPGNRSGTK